MSFYHQAGNGVLQKKSKKNPPLCEREVVSVYGGQLRIPTGTVGMDMVVMVQASREKSWGC